MRFTRLVLVLLCNLTACKGRGTAAADTPAAHAEDPLASPAAQVDAVDSVCTQMRAEAAEVLRPALAGFTIAKLEDHHRKVIDSLGQCHVGRGGAWVLQPLDMDFEDVAEDERAMEGAIGIVHVGRDGARMQFEEAFLMRLATSPDYGNDATIQVLAHHDYDGDGVDEIVIQRNESGYDLDHSTFDIFARHGNEVAFYAPTDEILIHAVHDYDGDGVLDLVSIEDFWAVNLCFDMGDGARVGVPAVLFHAGADGNFSAADEVARRFLREQCPQPPVRLLVGGKLEWEIDALERIACSRVWGKTEAQVVAQIRREWPKLASTDIKGDESCEFPVATFEAFAAIDPPAVLRR